jgi:hypothetical protein
LTDDEIGQIWAEALHLWKKGETLYLSRELEEQARKVQDEHTEESPLYGMIQQFLIRKLLANWNELGIYERRQFLNDSLSPEGTVERDKVCSIEIWTELLGGDPKRFPPFERREINDVLRRTLGWSGTKLMRFGDLYGHQRGFYREQKR